MSALYENQYLVNSFYAVKEENDVFTQLQADEAGFIEPDVGTILRFLGPVSNKPVPVNTLLITAGDADVALALNGNEKYPLYVPAGTSKGVYYMHVHSMKLLSGGGFSYEAMTDYS